MGQPLFRFAIILITTMVHLTEKLVLLLKLSSVLECNKLMIITQENEQVLEVDNKTIEVIPVWKWLLNL